MGKSITLIPKDVSERTIPSEDREPQGIMPIYQRRTLINTQLFFREKVAVKKSMRNFNNALQTTLPRERKKLSYTTLWPIIDTGFIALFNMQLP